MPGEKRVKYILVTGGVISGVGKGIISSSLGVLLKNNGYKVIAIDICGIFLEGSETEQTDKRIR